MAAATYIEKLPTITACQWDGSAEARDFIVGAYSGVAKGVDDRIEIQGAVHDYTLEQGTWILVFPNSTEPQELSDADFQAKYEAKAG